MDNHPPSTSAPSDQNQDFPFIIGQDNAVNSCIPSTRWGGSTGFSMSNAHFQNSGITTQFSHPGSRLKNNSLEQDRTMGIQLPRENATKPNFYQGRGDPSVRSRRARRYIFRTFLAGSQHTSPLPSDRNCNMISRNTDPPALAQTASGISSSTQSTSDDDGHVCIVYRLDPRAFLHPLPLQESSTPRPNYVCHTRDGAAISGRLRNSNPMALQSTPGSSSQQSITGCSNHMALQSTPGSSLQQSITGRSNPMALQSTPGSSLHQSITGRSNHMPTGRSQSAAIESRTRSLNCGVDCQGCQRDLNLNPTGPLRRHVNLPAVTVLPCGHQFHAHCLMNLAPHKLIENPPCICCEFVILGPPADLA